MVLVGGYLVWRSFDLGITPGTCDELATGVVVSVSVLAGTTAEPCRLGPQCRIWYVSPHCSQAFVIRRFWASVWHILEQYFVCWTLQGFTRYDFPHWVHSTDSIEHSPLQVRDVRSRPPIGCDKNGLALSQNQLLEGLQLRIHDKSTQE